ncbi:MAG: type IV pili methyl-accepting chemotaxis transducer N-terminal domain-containing protein, partial [Candidatus Dechloromonas phosphoritropha]
MFVVPGKLSRKIVGMLSVFFLVALAAIGMTLYLSWQLEGVAAAINDAGSQRMRAYRMVHMMSHGLAGRQDAAGFVTRLRAEIEGFDQVLLDLRRGDPSRPMAPPRDDEVGKRLLAVEDFWYQAIRPLVAGFLSQVPDRRRVAVERLDSQVEDFVGNINDLVLAMEQSYAANTNLLRSVQAAL